MAILPRVFGAGSTPRAGGARNFSILPVRKNIKEAATSLYAAKQRSVIALLGIVIGIGSVIALLSIGFIYKQETLKRFEDLGTDTLNIRNDSLREEAFRLNDVIRLAAETSSISLAAPWLSSFETFTHNGREIGVGRAVGVTAAMADMRKLTLETGRFISDLDYRQFYCVVGAELAQAMRAMGVEDILGQRIKAKRRLYTVVGVLNDAPRGRDLEPNRSVFVPITTAQRVFEVRKINYIFARMAPNTHYVAATADVVAYFQRKAPLLEIDVISAEELIEQIQEQMQLITLLLGVIGSIALIVGGVGVMNVMLVSVAERRQEIGLRRALGARRKDIETQFLIESLILSLLGGLLGIILGVASSYVICLFTGWDFSLYLPSIVFGVGVASGIGIFFGLYPAHRAARLDPITALRAP